eukprot:2741730-Lingulodinium_polyedra.AAC.1
MSRGPESDPGARKQTPRHPNPRLLLALRRVVAQELLERPAGTETFPTPRLHICPPQLSTRATEEL